MTKASEIEAVKRDLPDNLADLIDRRACYGVLKYPNLQFYTLVARLEYCYSKLATSQNILINSRSCYILPAGCS